MVFIDWGGAFRRWFACLNLLYDGEDHSFLQDLIAIGSVDSLLNFIITLTGPGEIGNKIPSARHAALSEG
jgi:hypothetical protein